MSDSSRQEKYLGRITHIVETVSNHVRERNLSPLSEPHWILEPDEAPGGMRGWLHKLYGGHSVWGAIWLLLVLLVFLLSFSIESSYAACWVTWTESSTASLNGTRVAMTVQVSIFTPLVLILTLGAYGMVREIVVNRDLAWWLKAGVIGVALVFAVLWSLVGFSLPTGLSLSDPTIDQVIIEIRQNSFYRATTALLVYFPPAISLIISGVQGLVILEVGFLSVFRWVRRFHKLESINAMRRFLSVPLSLRYEEPPLTLIDLESQEIESLHKWATCRREVVQGRLVPTTLLLSFLGILIAIPQVGQSVGSFIERIQSLTSFSNFWSLLASAIVVLLLFGLLKLLLNLLNEAFVTDYIAQACVLAEHVKRAEEEAQERSTSQASRSMGFIGCLIQWLSGRRTQE